MLDQLNREGQSTLRIAAQPQRPYPIRQRHRPEILAESHGQRAMLLGHVERNRLIGMHLCDFKMADHDLRDRLVIEASEHVLRFDWDDIAQRTRSIYAQLGKLARSEEGARRG